MESLGVSVSDSCGWMRLVRCISLNKSNQRILNISTVVLC